MHRLVIAFGVMMVAARVEALPRQLPPIDQCRDERSFVEFRDELKRIVARKDREAFLRLVDADILVNFGGDRGRDAFAKEWSFDATEYGNIWSQLETMLGLGCAEEEGARIIPSLIIQLNAYPDGDVADAVLILPGARLYKSAGVESAKPRTIPWTIAKVISREADWGTGVRLPDGRKGFIPDDRAYEPAGYRMIIEENRGRWSITAFVAGD